MLGCGILGKPVIVHRKIPIDNSVFIGCPDYRNFILKKGSTVKAMVKSGSDRLIAIKQCNAVIEEIKKNNGR